ncbi:hypothetical protein ASZ90_015824 [hydrocarbon metagenome]|uniref:Uncharacterized protein n=1 Tax=hydrocarbon metagenome TaxID=938273 RepID=A0A0W8F0W5_9ZZZZ
MNPLAEDLGKVMGDTLEIEKPPVIRTWVDLMKYYEDPHASLSTEMAQLIREGK